MTEKPKSKPGKVRSDAREERLSAALRANLARRKAQARARKTPPSDVPEKPDLE